MTRPLFISVLILLAAGPLADASAQEETFAAWSAECAGGLCVAHTMTPGGAVTLRLLPGDAPGAPWEIAVAGIQDDIKEGTPIEVSVDGSRPMRFAGDDYAVEGQRVVLTELRLAAPLYSMLLRGSRMALTFTHRTGAPLRLTFSLAGVTAATGWIEEQWARGAPPGEPPAATAQAPEPERREDERPEPESPPPEGQEPDAPAETAQPSQPPSPEPPPEREAEPSPEPVEVPDAVRRRHLADGLCEDYDDEDMQAARIAAELDEDRTLYLLPCTSAAYNLAYRAWIADNHDPNEVEQSLFAGYNEEQGWYGTDMVINPDYDTETKRLTALEKARGAGDCGSAPTWRWREIGWQLLQYRYQDACDGTRTAEDWPVIFEHPDH